MTTVIAPNIGSVAKPIHQLAQKGFGVGTNEFYDKVRPTYQHSVLEHVRKVSPQKKGLNVVEIGAGTGLFTRALLNDSAWQDGAIAQLHAIEPSEGMRDVFTRATTDPRVIACTEGTFDHIPGVPDGWADLIVVAQAFHWCPDHESAIKEFGRVLKPSGTVALVWNLEDFDAAPWVAQLRVVYSTYEQNNPHFHRGLWLTVSSAPSYNSTFTSPAAEDMFEWDVPATAQLVADRACSKSFIAVLPVEEQEKVKERVREVIGRGEGLVWVDEAQGVFRYPYKTWVISFQRK